MVMAELSFSDEWELTGPVKDRVNRMEKNISGRGPLKRKGMEARNSEPGRSERLLS